MHLLVVEDEQKLARLVKRVLEEERHGVDLAHDGASGYEMAATGRYDTVIMDLMLPQLDGIEVTRRLRQQGVDTPIIMLTARDGVQDRVSGLDAGADDYLVKPFALEELLARVRAVARRRQPDAVSATLQVGDLELDRARHQARRDSRRFDLSAKEFALLEFFMRHPNQVLTRAQIMDHVWEYDFDASSNVVDLYVHYLRNKIDRGFSTRLLHTIRGVGYVLGER